jgi:glycopeptide antibiotics resistance protein
VGAGLSALIELLQLGVPGRVTAWDDLALNTLGAAVGALLANAARYVGERLRHPPT